MAQVSKYKRGSLWWLRYAKDTGLRPRSVKTSDEKLAEAIRVNDEHKLVFSREGIRTGRISKVRFSEFVKIYMENKTTKGLRTGTLDNYLLTLNRVGDSLGRDLTVDLISVEHVEKYRRDLLEMGMSAKTIRNEIMILAGALRWAERRNFTPQNPTREMDLPKPVRYAPRPLRYNQYLALKAEIDDEAFRDILDFYVLTGIRRGDGPTLTFSEHIDIEGRTMTLPQSKQANTKVLHISDELLPIVRRLKLRAGDSDRVIPMHKSDLSKRFRKYADAAKLPKNLTFHSLRHSFGSWLAAAGVGLKTIQRLLGHSDPRSTDIYVGAFDEGLVEGIEKLRLPRATSQN